MRGTRPLGAGVLIVVLGACFRYTPPAPSAPRHGTAVAASFGRTWDAVIDVFAERNIPIRTIERSSGFIATENLTTPYEPTSARDRRDVKADCGHQGDVVYAPTHAVYNIVVRGDSARSTVRATVAWVSVVNAPKGESYQCSTTGLWEAGLEEAIRNRAEGAQALPVATPTTAPSPSVRAEGHRARPPVAQPDAGRAAFAVPVTIRVRVPDWVNDPAPVPDFPLVIIGPRGDTTALRTDGRGSATVSLPAGRYRVVSPERAGPAGGRQFAWDLALDVEFQMPPLVLDQRNAVRRAP